MSARQDRIRKLLALAADQAGTPEGELAAKIARQMVMDRARELAGLPHMERRALEPYVRRPLSLGGDSGWRRRLGSAVARHCACRLAWSWKERTAALYGPTSGVEIAEFLYLHASGRIERAVGAFMAGRAIPEERLAEVERAFCHSAVLALEGRFDALRRQELKVDPEGTALVVAVDRDLDAWIDEEGIPSRPPPFARHAFSGQGYAFGNEVPLQDAVRGGVEDREKLESA